jgi:glycine cleavage system transcriptional repressor
MMMLESDYDADALARLLAPVTQHLGLQVHVDAIEGALHEHAEPNVRIAVHGADRPGIVAQIAAALAQQGFNILDLNSDVAGTADQPIYVMVLDGYAGAGAAAVERALAPLRAGGIELRITPIDTLVG